MRTGEQVLRDRINLPRLVRRLERIVQDDWSGDGPANPDSWIKVRVTLQQIRHARSLLKKVELDAAAITPAAESERYYEYVKNTLQRLESHMIRIEKQHAPPLQRPHLILPSIPPPEPKFPVGERSGTTESLSVAAVSDDYHPLPSAEVENLLPATSDVTETPPSENVHAPSSNPSAASPLSSNITATPAILQNSRAVQEELSEQLALMARQLRRNATHFSDSLARDKVVVDAMQEKLEGNFDLLKKERVRLRDFRGKSGGTTCLVIMSVIIVVIAFILMVFVIRVT
ncbi:membrane fusion protein Use1-domain-containing protein [Pisolithus thermaeus]|nr:membrane fusion protein Use1-domain-containing protein [Pisolithus thermaeus]